MNAKYMNRSQGITLLGDKKASPVHVEESQVDCNP